MADSTRTTPDRRFPIDAVAGLIGLALLAYGISGLISGGSDFSTDPGGTVNGETWLGLEGNGWTNALFAVAGFLLILGMPTRAGVTAMTLLVGLALGAAAIVAVLDGDDVFGALAANGWTMIAWGATALVSIVAAALAASTAGRGGAGTVTGPPRGGERTDARPLARDLRRPPRGTR